LVYRQKSPFRAIFFNFQVKIEFIVCKVTSDKKQKEQFFTPALFVFLKLNFNFT